MAYDAFISYSHGTDGELAPMLRDGIQRFAKPWYRRRAVDVFLDNSSLSANPGLWSSITVALDDSQWLIVLLSERSAASPWVDREIAHWCASGRADRILPVLTSGTLAWDDAGHGWDEERCTSLPRAFVGAFDEEPRFIDLTWIDRSTPIDRREPRLAEAIADLAAPLHGVPKDELVGTDIREHRRALRLARTAVAVLVVLALAAASAAIVAQRNATQARRSQQAAERATSDAEFRALIAESRDLRRSKRELSLLLALEARKARITPESDGALQAAIIEDPRLLGPRTDRRFAEGYRSVCTIPGSTRSIVGGNDGTYEIVDLEASADHGRPSRPAPRRRLVRASTARAATLLTKSSIGCAVSDDGHHAAVFAATGEIWPLALPGGVLGPPVDLGRDANQVALSPDGRWIAAGTTDGHLDLWASDDPGGRTDLVETDELSSVGVVFTPDGATLVSTTRGALRYRHTGDWMLTREVDDPVADQSGGLVELPDPTRRLSVDRRGRFLLNIRRGVERLHDLAGGKVRWEVGNNFASGATATFARDGSSVMVTGTSGIFTERTSLDGRIVGQPIRGLENTSDPAVSGDGRTFYLPSLSGPAIGRWALDGRSTIATMIDAPGMRAGRSATVGNSIVVVPSGPSVVSAGEVRSLASGAVVGRFPTVAFPTLLHPHLVTGFYLDLLQVDRLDVTTRAYTGPRYPVDIGGVVQVAVDARGRVVVSYDDGTLRRFEPDGHEVGSPWKRLPSPADTNVLISPGARYIGVSGEDVRILSGQDGRVLHRFRDRYLTSFSADGRSVGLLSPSGMVEIRRTDSGRLLRRVQIDPTYNAYDLSHGAVHVAAAGEEAQLYDPATLRPIGDPFPSLDTPRLIGSGDRLATNTAQGIQIWDLHPGHWASAACAMAGRNLTKQEQRAYLPAGTAAGPTCPQWPAPS